MQPVQYVRFIGALLWYPRFILASKPWHPVDRISLQGVIPRRQHHVEHSRSDQAGSELGPSLRDGQKQKDAHVAHGHLNIPDACGMSNYVNTAPPFFRPEEVIRLIVSS